MEPDRPLVIVGGGLVGSLLAGWLARRGLPVVVFEKRPDPRRTELPAGRSINLALAERGIHALEAAGVMDAIRPLLIPMRGRILHDHQGQIEFQPYGSRPDEVIHSVSRTELNRRLLDFAERQGARLNFNQSVEQADLRRSIAEVHDQVRDVIAEQPFQWLIGADGMASIVRDTLVDHVGGQGSIDRLDHDYKELCIAADDGGGHRLEKEGLHIWPRGGYMLIALPNLDGSFTVTLFLPRTGQPSFAALNSPRQVEDFFAREFPDATALIPDLATQFFEHPTGSLGTVRCDTWSDGRSALILGDAAHAVVPFHGQGMNAGFEDCEVLVDCLDRHDGDLPAAVAEFVSQRPTDAAAIAEMALQNYITMRDSVTDPRFVRKKQLSFELEHRFPDRFIPRYSMVMFHRIPYAEVFRRGQVQEAILDQLIDHPLDSGQIDYARAERLIAERLRPWRTGG